MCEFTSAGFATSMKCPTPSIMTASARGPIMAGISLSVSAATGNRPSREPCMYRGLPSPERSRVGRSAPEPVGECNPGVRRRPRSEGEGTRMGAGPLVAEGTDSTVSIVGDKVVVQRRGVMSILKQGFALYRDPRSLAGAFEGPSKKVVTAALLENRDLAKVIVGAVKGTRPADDGDVSGRALADALKENRQAVVQAVKENDALVKAWLRDHKELAGIVLKGDAH